MKILIPNCPYSAIPRLAKEGKIKVGTRVKACEDQKKYPNGFTRSMQKGVICEIAEISDEWFRIQYEGIISMSVPYSQYMDFFLDILEDEKEEPKQYGRSPFRVGITVDAPRPDIEKAEKIVREAEEEEGVLTHGGIGKSADPKPLSFDEPLTKEAVGRWVEREEEKAVIVNISIDGEYARLEWSENLHDWIGIDRLKRTGWHFESSPEEISIAEAEKLTGKKIKR